MSSQDSTLPMGTGAGGYASPAPTADYGSDIATPDLFGEETPKVAAADEASAPRTPLVTVRATGEVPSTVKASPTHPSPKMLEYAAKAAVGAFEGKKVELPVESAPKALGSMSNYLASNPEAHDPQIGPSGLMDMDAGQQEGSDAPPPVGFDNRKEIKMEDVEEEMLKAMKDEELSDKLGQTTDSSYSLSASQTLGSNVSMSDRMGSSTETGATDHVEELLHAPVPVPVDPNMHLAKLPSFLGCHPGLQKSVRVDFSNTTGLTYHAYRAIHAAIQLEAVEIFGAEVTKHRRCLDYIGIMLHYRAIVCRISVAKI